MKIIALKFKTVSLFCYAETAGMLVKPAILIYFNVVEKLDFLSLTLRVC